MRRHCACWTQRREEVTQVHLTEMVPSHLHVGRVGVSQKNTATVEPTERMK